MSLLPPNLSRQQRRAALARFDRDNARHPVAMFPVPAEAWPVARVTDSSALAGMWRSRSFLAQLFQEDRYLRLSVNRSTVDDRGERWVDGITWDELMRVKTQCGFGEWWGVEVYPATASIVDVANIRHLWLFREAPPFAWKKS